MNVSLNGLDREIQQLEQRLADDRAAFVGALSECTDSARETMRETMSSPKTLLAMAAVGFVTGKLLFRPAPTRVVHKESQRGSSAAGGALGLLAAGLSLMRPGSGTGGLARWALQQLWERRKKSGAAGGVRTTMPRKPPTGATPEVRLPPRAAHRKETRAAASR